MREIKDMEVIKKYRKMNTNIIDEETQESTKIILYRY